MGRAAGRAGGAFVFEAAIEDGKVVLCLEGADGFLSTILPEGGSRWTSTSSPDGRSHRPPLGGRAALAVDLPVDFDLGPIRVQMLHVELGSPPTGLTLEAVGRDLSHPRPVRDGVDRMGTLARLTFQEAAATSGPPASRWSSSRRRASGSVLDAGIVAAAATSTSTPTRASTPACWSSHWAGAIKAIGILTTSCPTAPGLGTAAAGLQRVPRRPARLRVHPERRRRDRRPAARRLHGRTPVRAAHRRARLRPVPARPRGERAALLGRLRLVFPIVPRALTVGPALRIGWSTPPLVTLNLGLVLQFDDVLGGGPGPAAAQPHRARGPAEGAASARRRGRRPGARQAAGRHRRQLRLPGAGAERRRCAARLPRRGPARHRLAGRARPLRRADATRARRRRLSSPLQRHPSRPPGPGSGRHRPPLRHRRRPDRRLLRDHQQHAPDGRRGELKAAGAGFPIEAYLGFDALFLFEPVFHFRDRLPRRRGHSLVAGRSLASVRVTGRAHRPRPVGGQRPRVDLDPVLRRRHRLRGRLGGAPPPALPSVSPWDRRSRPRCRRPTPGRRSSPGRRPRWSRCAASTAAPTCSRTRWARSSASRRSCRSASTSTRVGRARAVRRQPLRHHRRRGRRRRGDAPLPRRALRPGRVPRPHRGGEALAAVVRAVPGRVAVSTADYQVPAAQVSFDPGVGDGLPPRAARTARERAPRPAHPGGAGPVRRGGALPVCRAADRLLPGTDANR